MTFRRWREKAQFMWDVRLDWQTWIDGLGPAMLAAAVWTFLLAGAAMIWVRGRRSYQHGLGAAVAAFFGVTGITAALAEIGGPFWIVLLIVAPLVEETARLLFAMEVRRDPPAWIAFGAGYGLFEAGLKFADALVLHLRDPIHPVFTLVALLAPLMVLLIHVALSVVMLALLSARVPPLAAWAVSVTLHAVNNWTVVAFQITEITDAAASLALRFAVLIALIALFLPAARRKTVNSEDATG